MMFTKHKSLNELLEDEAFLKSRAGLPFKWLISHKDDIKAKCRLYKMIYELDKMCYEQTLTPEYMFLKEHYDELLEQWRDKEAENEFLKEQLKDSQEKLEQYEAEVNAMELSKEVMELTNHILETTNVTAVYVNKTTTKKVE